MSAPAVFLDRDGVLNARRFPILRHARDLVMLPGAADAAARLAKAGYATGIVTNQEWVSRGLLSRAEHDAIMARVAAALDASGAKLTAAYAALDASNAKPRPDMILQAAREHDLDLAASFMVGDNLKDMLAGERAGCRTVLVDPRLRTRVQGAHRHATHVARDVPAAADWILNRARATTAGTR